jgi:riboflavin synthase
MFTGIIEGLGTIVGVQPSHQGQRLAVRADFEPDQTKIGDSVAVNGACLTVIRIDGKRFDVDVSPETLAKTTLGRSKIGDRVNLERALRLSDRLDGHLVSGHVDGIGTLQSKRSSGNAISMTFRAPEALARYMIQKGSVAVDGTSLTINRCDANSFTVSIIPYTSKMTILDLKQIGDPVNIETDLIGKYVERFCRQSQDKEKRSDNAIDMQFLTNTGFL